ncbi:MAG: hypothetical protein ACLP1Y_01115 [Candidatus Acidiferrales bacterium]
MKQTPIDLKKLARLLETAAKKRNESVDATCSVANCFDRSDGDLSDEMFVSVFDTVTELAGIRLENKPDYPRAARELIARIKRMRLHGASAKKFVPRRKLGQTRKSR